MNKKIKLISPLLLVVFFSIILTSCSDINNADISNNLVGCTWIYEDSYEEYDGSRKSFYQTLTFDSDGTVEYQSDRGFTAEGLWTISKDGIIHVNYGSSVSTDESIDFKLVDDETLKAHPGGVIYHKK